MWCVVSPTHTTALCSSSLSLALPHFKLLLRHLLALPSYLLCLDHRISCLSWLFFLMSYVYNVPPHCKYRGPSRMGFLEERVWVESVQGALLDTWLILPFNLLLWLLCVTTVATQSCLCSVPFLLWQGPVWLSLGFPLSVLSCSHSWRAISRCVWQQYTQKKHEYTSTESYIPSLYRHIHHRRADPCMCQQWCYCISFQSSIRKWSHSGQQVVGYKPCSGGRSSE